LSEIKGELYTPLTEQLKLEIKRAAQLEGGVTRAALVWGVDSRSLFRILHDNKLVSLTWLDKFCLNAQTEHWITDFEWFNYKELLAMGDWESNGGRNQHSAAKPCKACGAEVEGTGRKVFCGEECMTWFNRHMRIRAT
jgi:hypothetical protein